MATAEQLRAMELQLKSDDDEVLRFGQWTRKSEILGLVKRTNQSEKPRDDSEWWRTAGGIPECPGAPRCNLPILVARLSARVIGGNTFQFGGSQGVSVEHPDREIPEEGFLVKKKMAIWSMKHMLFTKAASEDFGHLDIAASKAAYAVPNYDEFLPTTALDAQQFIDEFYNKHIGDNPRLEKTQIRVVFSAFTCGL